MFPGTATTRGLAPDPERLSSDELRQRIARDGAGTVTEIRRSLRRRGPDAS